MVLDLGMYDEEIDTKGKARRQQLKYPIRGQGQGLGSSYPDWVGSGLVVVKVGYGQGGGFTRESFGISKTKTKSLSPSYQNR